MVAANRAIASAICRAVQLALKALSVAMESRASAAKPDYLVKPGFLAQKVLQVLVVLQVPVDRVEFLDSQLLLERQDLPEAMEWMETLALMVLKVLMALMALKARRA